MKTIFLIIVSIVSISCSTPEYKVCEFETEDKELKLYHDILSELIEQHFYNGYLGQVSEQLEKYPPVLEFSDTVAFKKDLILAQNRLFNNTSKFETICYRASLESGPWKFLQADSTDFFARARTDTTKYMHDLKILMTSFSPNWEAVADTIGKSQTKYNSEDFKLCTSKVISCRHFNESDIGVVGFSKVVMNEDKTKGLLYYEFTCGGKCGMGEIILVELVNQRWTIKRVNQLWIS